jgi:hypothetical protein
MQKAKYSSAKEPISTEYANKHATQMVGAIKESRSPVICQRQMQASQCRLSKKLLQAALINESPLDGTLDGWKNEAGLLSSKEENTSP